MCTLAVYVCEGGGWMWVCRRAELCAHLPTHTHTHTHSLTHARAKTGGFVALDVAKKLQDKGKEVALVVIIDQ